MAIKRMLGVEFAREGFRAADDSRPTEPSRGSSGSEDAIARKRAALTYGSAILRTLHELDAANTDGVSPRDLFQAVRERQSGDMKFADFQLALSGLYDDRYVESVGTDDFGDPRYSITKLGLAIAAP